MKDSKALFRKSDAKTMRSIDIKDIRQVDQSTFATYVKEAIALNEQGAKIEEKSLSIPSDFKKALQSRKLMDKFEALSYTNRKEFIRSITEAKRQETREARILKSVALIAQGKSYR